MTLTAASPVNIDSSRFIRSGKMPSTGLKIRCPKGRAGSTPALGTILKSAVHLLTLLNPEHVSHRKVRPRSVRGVHIAWRNKVGAGFSTQTVSLKRL